MIKGNININIDIDISKPQVIIMGILFLLFCTNVPAWLVYYKFDKYLPDSCNELSGMYYQQFTLKILNL